MKDALLICLQIWKQKSQNGIGSLHLAMVTKWKRDYNLSQRQRVLKKKNILQYTISI